MFQYYKYKLKGEKIIQADPHIGLLHRGTEKFKEYKTCSQNILNRLYYIIIQNSLYIKLNLKVLILFIGFIISFYDILINEKN